MSQTAAYELLLEACKDSLVSLNVMADKLINWHHKAVETQEWEYLPPVEGRASSGRLSTVEITPLYIPGWCYRITIILQLLRIHLSLV